MADPGVAVEPIAGAWHLRVLGTASAFPHPRPGCDCPQCAEGIRRRRAALLVEGRHTALVDAGGSLYDHLRMLSPLPQIERVLLTHVHTDHYIGLDDLLMLSPQRLPLWALDDNWPHIERAFPYLFESRGDKAPPLVRQIAPFAADANWLAADEWCTATPVDTHHVDYFTTVGLVFADKASPVRIGYCPDLHHLDDAGMAALHGADLLLIDGTQWEGETHSHTTIPQALALCRTLEVRQPVLTHIGHLKHDSATLRTWIDQAGYPEALVAEDGLRITVRAGRVRLDWPA